MALEPTKRRTYWVAELAKLSGSFGDDSTKLEELRGEIAAEGEAVLIDHLRVCGAIPEQYGHDSSEEKLYSKYTDALIAEALSAMGLRSTVIDSRGDSADVQARAANYSLVADAKAFRLSRTAKNQKDFKVQAMDRWRNGLDHAIVVCPIYQLPKRSSQIYHQAIAHNVCILSYSHFAVLVALASKREPATAEAGFLAILKRISLLNPDKDASTYWNAINGALVDFLEDDVTLWTAEKAASIDAFAIVKQESLLYLKSLLYLTMERDRLLGLSHQQALNELIRMAGLDSRIATVNGIEHGSLLGA